MKDEIKKIIKEYLNYAKLPALLIGTYRGGAVVINDRFTIPGAQLTGNLKGQVREGDKVRLLAPTGWDEYCILEIIGRPGVLKDEAKAEALK